MNFQSAKCAFLALIDVIQTTPSCHAFCDKFLIHFYEFPLARPSHIKISQELMYTCTCTCLYFQLREPTVRRMAELLEKANSSYFQVFKEMFRDVVACKCDVTRELDTRLVSATCQTSCQYVVVGFAALTEAQDINMYLKPLRNHFDDYEQIDFDSSEKLLQPMFHCLCLVWANSKYYNTPGRVVVLLQEMCNMMIDFVSARLNCH